MVFSIKRRFFFLTDFNENVDCQFNSVVFIFNLAIVENKHQMVTISNQYRMSYDPIREKTINAAIPRQKIFWASSETNK